MKTLNLLTIFLFIPSVLCMQKNSKTPSKNNAPIMQASKQAKNATKSNLDNKILIDSLRDQNSMLKKQNENLQSELERAKKDKQQKQSIIENQDWRLYHMQKTQQDSEININSLNQINYQLNSEFEELYKYTCRIEAAHMALQSHYQQVKNKLLSLAAFMGHPMFFYGYNVTYVPEQPTQSINVPSSGCQETSKVKDEEK